MNLQKIKGSLLKGWSKAKQWSARFLAAPCKEVQLKSSLRGSISMVLSEITMVVLMCRTNLSWGMAFALSSALVVLSVFYVVRHLLWLKEGVLIKSSRILVVVHPLVCLGLLIFLWHRMA